MERARGCCWGRLAGELAWQHAGRLGSGSLPTLTQLLLRGSAREHHAWGGAAQVWLPETIAAAGPGRRPAMLQTGRCVGSKLASQ